MWGQINNEYAILSTALPSLDILGKKINDRWEVPHLCHYSWDEKSVILPFTSSLQLTCLMVSVRCQSLNFLQWQSISRSLFSPPLGLIPFHLANVMHSKRSLPLSGFVSSEHQV
jgi:hypothetical protein